MEDSSGFQPSNIGSSEGIMKEQVKLDQAGTPSKDDIILHIDFLFEQGEGRTAEGIIEAHRAADEIINEIRTQMAKLEHVSFESERYQDVKRPGRRKGILPLQYKNHWI